LDRWHLLRPVLPPGTALRELHVRGGRYWLASDRGLLWSHDLSGPWKRAQPPAGRASVAGLVGLGDQLWLATNQGLLVGNPAPRIELASEGRASDVLAGEPDLLELQNATLGYLGLEVERIDAHRAGLKRRGWYPSVALRFGYDRGHRRTGGWDESFSYGELHELADENEDRADDFDASILLSWDLGDLAFDPEFIDLSRESRLIIGLRDDVLDEVNQIFFERRALLLQLAEGPPPGLEDADANLPMDRRSLELRVAELTAGLDAWSGGWFSTRLAQLQSMAPRSPIHHPDSERN
jgi:hypothetical protein